MLSAGRAKTQVAGSGSVLTILAAEIPDSGVFLCVANNGVPKAAPAEISQIFYLLVRRELNMELDLKKFIWAPVHSCAHWLRTPASPPLPLHLGSYTRALLVSQERPTSPCNPLVFAIIVPKLLFYLLYCTVLYSTVVVTPLGRVKK